MTIPKHLIPKVAKPNKKPPTKAKASLDFSKDVVARLAALEESSAASNEAMETMKQELAELKASTQSAAE